jgi:hypothetical protein
VLQGPWLTVRLSRVLSHCEPCSSLRSSFSFGNRRALDSGAVHVIYDARDGTVGFGMVWLASALPSCYLFSTTAVWFREKVKQQLTSRKAEISARIRVLHEVCASVLSLVLTITSFWCLLATRHGIVVTSAFQLSPVHASKQ